MSNQENDKIWESACERAEQEGVDVGVFCEYDYHIEDIYQYLKTGKLPDDYESDLYRMYKA